MSQRINLKFTKRNKKPSIVLSKEKVRNIIEVIRNPKHKSIISLAYSASRRLETSIKT